MKLLITIALISFLASCSNKEKKEVTNEHEMQFNRVADSLIKYQQEILQIVGSEDKLQKDFTTLDYVTFKKKHQFNDAEMDELAATFTITYKIAQSLKAIDLNSLESIDSLKISD